MNYLEYKTNQNRIIQDDQHDDAETTDAKQENGADDDSEKNADNENQPNQEKNEDESNAKESNEPVMEIEGIVQGEADNNVVQSASRLNAMYDDDNKV